MKPYKEWSLATRILVPVAFTLIFALSLLAWTIGSRSAVALRAVAERELVALAGEHGSSIKDFFNTALEESKALADATSAVLNKDLPFTREQYLAMLSGLERSNPDFVTAGAAFAKDTFGGQGASDAPWANTAGSTAEGRFSPCLSEDKVTVIQDADRLPFYTEAQKRGAYLMPPYLYQLKGKNVLVTTASSAVKRNGVFQGAVYVDLLVELVSRQVMGIHIYETGDAALLTDDGTVVAHKNADFIGKNAFSLAAPDLKNKMKLVLDSRKAGLVSWNEERNGKTAAFFTYYYPIVFEATGQTWFLRLTVPEQEVLAEAQAIRSTTISFSAGILLLTLIVVALLLRRAIKPLAYMASVASEVADGNFTVQIDVSRYSGEVLQLHHSLERMLMALLENINKAEAMRKDAAEQAEKARIATQEADKMRSAAENAKREGMLAAASRLEGVARVLATASEELAGRIESSDKGASEQAARMAETATAMEEMNATVIEVARTAGAAAEVSVSTRQEAVDGAEVVRQAVDGIHAVQRQSLKLKDDMRELDANAQAISAIMRVISDIADQTNLLALNAAIEAARAGDAGRGFAVVADEVRKLAEKTMASTQDVSKAISAIQKSAGQSMAQVEASAQAIEEAAALAAKSGEALGSITHLVDRTADQVRGIAAASEQQASSSEEINRSISLVNEIAGSMSSAMRSASQSVSELSVQAQDLARLVEEMKRG